MALTLSKEVREKYEDMGYWIQRVQEGRRQVLRSTGNNPEWLILSHENWTKIKDVWGPVMVKDLRMVGEAPSFMGLKLALSISGNQSADILVVR